MGGVGARAQNNRELCQMLPQPEGHWWLRCCRLGGLAGATCSVRRRSVSPHHAGFPNLDGHHDLGVAVAAESVGMRGVMWQSRALLKRLVRTTRLVPLLALTACAGAVGGAPDGASPSPSASSQAAPLQA